jgi:hypothetical protein
VSYKSPQPGYFRDIINKILREDWDSDDLPAVQAPSEKDMALQRFRRRLSRRPIHSEIWLTRSYDRGDTLQTLFYLGDYLIQSTGHILDNHISFETYIEVQRNVDQSEKKAREIADELSDACLARYKFICTFKPGKKLDRNWQVFYSKEFSNFMNEEFRGIGGLLPYYSFDEILEIIRQHSQKEPDYD